MPERGSDTAALRLLRELLAEDRAAGYSFSEAWADDFAFVARKHPTWAVALESTRAAWAAAYTGHRGPGFGLNPSMLDHVADDRPTFEVAAA
jgi:hypothetical protein